MKFNFKSLTIIWALLVPTFALADCAQFPRACSIVQLCSFATEYSEAKDRHFWSLNHPRHYNEAKDRGIRCLTNVALPKIMREKPVVAKLFVKLGLSQRKQIQENLANLGLYKSDIDGLYGQNTLLGLRGFNSKHFNNVDLEKAENATALLFAISNLRNRQKGHEKPQDTIPAPDRSVENEVQKVASGTGFYVSKVGHILTNNHVIDGCEETKVHSKGKVINTVKIASDTQNDLALLKVDNKPLFVFALSEEGSYPLQDIIVAGFPFGERVSSTLKFTKGIVSSVAGLGNNYSEIQIDAALQPGNSGGPIIDEYGNVIAVAVSKLDMKKILKDYGVIPENTNFGVKASVVKNLMQGNSVPIKKPNRELISKADLSQSVTEGTVYLTCWMTTAQIVQLRNRKVLFSDFEE
jgi:S1-C subfamily serine protease